MKALALVLVGLFVSGLVAAPAYAATSASAVVTILATVAPQVSVTTRTPLASAGTIRLGQTGDLYTSVVWTISANSDVVKFTLEASDLFKGDDPLNSAVAPIAVNPSMPAEIIAANGNEINSGDNRAAWVGNGSAIGSFPTRTTETVTYMSAQPGLFSQDVTTKVFYAPPEPNKPAGRYSGKIRLTTMITTPVP